MKTVTKKIVPVSCSRCEEDMAFIITTFNENMRYWRLECPDCGLLEDHKLQKRTQLWIGTEFIGTYWGPIDD